MAQLIKDERKKRHIRGDVISRALGKTNTFISQIETGKISEIDSKLFYGIFRNIIDEDIFESYLNELTHDTKRFKQKYSVDEIEKEKAFVSFQERYCLIPISDKLALYIKDQIEALNISGAQLIEEINRNKTLSNPERYNDNEFIIDSTENDGKFVSSIKFNLESNLIDNIVSGKEKSICYIFMLGIVFNLQMLSGKNEFDSKLLAEQILSNLNFLPPYKMDVKYKESKKNDPEHFDLFEYEHYEEYEELIKNINENYLVLKAVNILKINNALKQHLENLEDDKYFTLALLSSPLSKIPKEKRSEFFNEYRDLIKRYINVSSK